MLHPERYSSPAPLRRTGMGGRELQESSSTVVGIYITSVLSRFSNIHFLNGYASLTKYAKMLVINPARKNSGSSKNLLTYYMGGRFTGGGNREVYRTCRQPSGVRVTE